VVTTGVVSVSAVVVGAVASGSSSPPQPAAASAVATRHAARSFRVNFCGQMPIGVSAESHNAGTLDTR
jgi:hypothetical protein